MANNQSIKNELQKSSGGKAAKTPQSIQQWVKAYEGQIAKALPSVLTPERFSRMALTALTKTPKLASCDPKTFIGSMLTAAQLGLEPNTPLGQAYLIPYGKECQFQLGYKGLIDLAYRSGQIKCIMAEIVYENDEFSFEYGLNPDLKHKPAISNRGEKKWVYALYKLNSGGFAFKVMSIDDIIEHGKKFSKTFSNGPWQTNFDEMAKKTVLKQLLKYAPLASEFVKGAVYDERTLEFDTTHPDDPDVVAVDDYTVSDSEEDSGAANVSYDKETGELDDLSGTPFEEKA